MQVFFVRHGQSMGNLTGDYSTDANDQLSELGHQQAAALHRRLLDLDFDAVYCSPLKRALQTIEPYATQTKTTVEVWPEIAEACWQEDRSHQEISDYRTRSKPLPIHHHDGLFTFKENKAVCPIDEETYAEGLFRLQQSVEQFKDLHGGTNDHILVVGHGFALARIIEYFLDIDPIGRFDHGNTGMSHLIEVDGVFAMQYLNRL